MSEMPKEIWAMDYIEGLEPNTTTKRVWWPDGGGDTTKYIRADLCKEAAQTTEKPNDG